MEGVGKYLLETGGVQPGMGLGGGGEGTGLVL